MIFILCIFTVIMSFGQIEFCFQTFSKKIAEKETNFWTREQKDVEKLIFVPETEVELWKRISEYVDQHGLQILSFETMINIGFDDTYHNYNLRYPSGGGKVVMGYRVFYKKIST
jgi:hypothetical protein